MKSLLLCFGFLMFISVPISIEAASKIESKSVSLLDHGGDSKARSKAKRNSKSKQVSKNSKKKTKRVLSRKNPEWAFKRFADLSRKNSKKFFKVADRLFSEDRLNKSKKLAKFAYDWQHRLAIIYTLERFVTEPRNPSTNDQKQNFERSVTLIEGAMLKDPSLLVRDAAVEVVRRSVHLYPTMMAYWKPRLESAFLDSKNTIQGEGLFIKQTILATLKESAIQPSKKVQVAAQADKNPQVRMLLQNIIR